MSEEQCERNCEGSADEGVGAHLKHRLRAYVSEKKSDPSAWSFLVAWTVHGSNKELV